MPVCVRMGHMGAASVRLLGRGFYMLCILVFFFSFRS